MGSHILSPVSTRTGPFQQAAVRWGVIPVCASLVIALAAHVAFPLPFTPVPFTLQPLAVLGVALALGPWEAAWTLLLYLFEGAMGAPVFSPTGPGGLAQLFGPTGGYLLAYPVTALTASMLTRFTIHRCSPFISALLGCTAATIVLFAAGSAWLAAEAHFTVRQVLFAAVWPFLPGEGIKILAAAGIYRAVGPSTSTTRTL